MFLEKDGVALIEHRSHLPSVLIPEGTPQVQTGEGERALSADTNPSAPLYDANVRGA